MRSASGALFALSMVALVPHAQGGPSTVAYSRTGHGPAVVFIHGLGADRTEWAAEIRRLSSRYTVIAVDLPGHGKAPDPKRVSFPEIAREIAGIIRQENAAPAVVVGHSLGGVVASFLPFVAPATVRALVLIDTLLAPTSFPAQERAKLLEGLSNRRDATLRTFYRALTKDNAQLDRVVAMARRVSPATFVAYLDEAAQHSAGEHADRISVPVLVLTSPVLLTRPESALAAEASFSALKTAAFQTFPATKHWIFWDAPAEFDAALDRFLPHR